MGSSPEIRLCRTSSHSISPKRSPWSSVCAYALFECVRTPYTESSGSFRATFTDTR